MSKTLSARHFAVVKSTAKNVAPMVKKIETLRKKVAALEDEIATMQTEVDVFETGCIALTGGYRSSELLDRVETVKTDAEGNSVKRTEFVPKSIVTLNSDGSYTIEDVEEDHDGQGEETVPVEE